MTPWEILAVLVGSPLFVFALWVALEFVFPPYGSPRR